jgi:xylulokinase
MGQAPLYLGIDSGTQGCKVVAFDPDKGVVCAEGSAPHELLENPRGGREQDPAQWVTALDAAMDQVLARIDPSRVVAMGVSGQQHGCVPLDAAGQVIRPAKLWCDTETVDQCERLTRALGGEEAVLAAIGNSVAAGFTASKVLWLREQEPANYQRLATVLLPHDYLNLYLTGVVCTEYGDASGTAYFDVRARSWSEAMVEAIDPSGRLASCLPELIASDAPCGTLRPELAAQWRLGSRVLVSSGGGDNMMAAIGTGNVRPGVITTSLGTSGTIAAFSSTPVIDPRGELAAFCSSSGGWLPLVCTMNVTVATELVRGLACASVEELNALAAQAPAGAEGLLLLPYFNGERTPPLPRATATLHGMTAGNCSRANCCRAAMEGATLGLRHGLAVLERCGIVPQEIRLVGGGAKSPLWRQMVADIFGLPVVTPVTTEAGALGAALQALWCHDHHQGGNLELTAICDQYVHHDPDKGALPQVEAQQRYLEVYQRYLELEQTLRPLNGTPG